MTAPEDSAAASDVDPGAKPDPSTTTGSSPASFADKKAFNVGVRRIVGVASKLLHRALDPGENDVWLADRQDLEEIGDPLTNILVRHAPIPAGKGGDVGDGLSLLSAVGGYVLKNLDRRQLARGRAYLDEEGRLVPVAGLGNPTADTVEP